MPKLNLVLPHNKVYPFLLPSYSLSFALHRRERKMDEDSFEGFIEHVAFGDFFPALALQIDSKKVVHPNETQIFGPNT